jgi:hypothetical protein
MVAGAAGVVIGVAVSQGIHAPHIKTAVPAYVIAEVETDPSKPHDPEAARGRLPRGPAGLTLPLVATQTTN